MTKKQLITWMQVTIGQIHDEIVQKGFADPAMKTFMTDSLAHIIRGDNYIFSNIQIKSIATLVEVETGFRIGEKVTLALMSFNSKELE